MERPFFSDVESLFSEFINFYGGEIVETLDQNLVDRPNADYFFPNQNTIAELKTFKKDVFSELEDLSRIEDLMQKWVSKKMITPKELRNFYNGNGLPENCKKDLISVASRTIERAIQKANKQIDESKKL